MCGDWARLCTAPPPPCNDRTVVGVIAADAAATNGDIKGVIGSACRDDNPDPNDDDDRLGRGVMGSNLGGCHWIRDGSNSGLTL